MKKTLSFCLIVLSLLFLVDCHKKKTVIEPPESPPSTTPRQPEPQQPTPPVPAPAPAPPKTLPPPPPPKKRAPAPGDSAALRLVESGAKELNAGNLENAEQTFEQALRVSPQNSKPYYYLGVVALRRNQPDRALAFLSQAEDRSNDDAFWMSQIQLQQGLAYKSLGQKEKAREKFKRALEQDPTNSHAKKELGSLP